MRISTVDYWLTRLAIANRRLLWTLGDIETQFFRRRLSSVTIERPIFICGLARSGSTMLLELLAQQPGVVTHRYRDFPLLTIPIWWNRFLDRTARKLEPQPRAHRDLIQITPQSPEGMAEVLWERYRSLQNKPREPLREPGFQKYYTEHLRKLLWLRDGNRYVSKNSYHLARIGRLAKLFPDAQFIIPLRHPFGHVESLVRQHIQFCEYARHDQRVPTMLSAAGHYEFGPQRSARGIGSTAKELIERRWAEGDEYGGYAILWAKLYGRVLRLLEHTKLSSRLHVVKYEDFCKHPQACWQQLATKLNLPKIDIDMRHVEPPKANLMPVKQQERVFQAAGKVAEHFGYSNGDI